MRRKRFTHYAHTICDKFCGWEKWPDDALFSDRPGGVIVADALTEEATLDGVPYCFSALAGVRAWLVEDLSAQGIPSSALTRARIELSFLCNPLPSSPGPGYELHFWGRGIVESGGDKYEVPYKKSERYVRG